MAGFCVWCLLDNRMRGIRGERVSLYVSGYLCLVSGQRTVGAFVVTCYIIVLCYCECQMWASLLLFHHEKCDVKSRSVSLVSSPRSMQSATRLIRLMGNQQVPKMTTCNQSEMRAAVTWPDVQTIHQWELTIPISILLVRLVLASSSCRFLADLINIFDCNWGVLRKHWYNQSI